MKWKKTRIWLVGISIFLITAGTVLSSAPPPEAETEEDTIWSSMAEVFAEETAKRSIKESLNLDITNPVYLESQTEESAFSSEFDDSSSTFPTKSPQKETETVSVKEKEPVPTKSVTTDSPDMESSGRETQAAVETTGKETQPTEENAADSRPQETMGSTVTEDSEENLAETTKAIETTVAVPQQPALNRTAAEQAWNLQKEIIAKEGYSEATADHTGYEIQWSERLYELACQRAAEIAADFSHNGKPSGTYENIAMAPEAGSVIQGWYNSEGHRKNMLGGAYYGAIANYGQYWVALYAMSE